MSLGQKKTESLFTENVVAVQDEPDDFVLLKVENRKAAERRVVRRLDMRLTLTVAVIYVMNYIDRVAVTAARLQGLEADLGLSDVEYETVIAVLFASYSPAQIPSNMILAHISRPSFYIGACVMAWGLTSALTGVTKNFSGIVACRIFIGLPEAAFYPGSMYLLSRWYTRGELALRSAAFFVGLIISNAFGSLIAAGILGNFQGKLGIAAWRWLFYIEGAVTMFIGLLAMWLLPDLPHNTRWMSPAERRLVQVRLVEDVGEADKDCSEATILDGFKLAIRDVKVWIFMLMCCSQILGLSFINFFPTLTATLGYNTTDTLLLAAPPWVFASICCIINAWNCDRTGERYFHMAAWWWVTIVGYIIALATMSTGARYFSLFLMSSGLCGSALILNWVSNTIPRPPAKRAVAIGLVNGMGNLGGLMGSYIWKARWGPAYKQSMLIALCSLVLSSILGMVMRQMLIHENKQWEREAQEFTQGQRERIEEAARLEGISFEEAVRRRRGFHYLY
ncbi:major facilitator superfamily domain-containing protein [Boletus reticuloceps]|uniref:Major facilitator superfamily domain-containing protein n=1 Tax=Boletus reticuloceps TaxID=495285 RepID=A0A8I2YVV1_9AGAM|nr:major facilitator superfamily domain-containing protein [Boletus reticuloceps]